MLHLMQNLKPELLITPSEIWGKVSPLGVKWFSSDQPKVGSESITLIFFKFVE